MHFILLVYKYEYIMNKNSYFVDFFMLCVILQYNGTHGDQIMEILEISKIYSQNR